MMWDDPLKYVAAYLLCATAALCFLFSVPLPMKLVCVPLFVVAGWGWRGMFR